MCNRLGAKRRTVMEIYPKQKSPPGCANGEDKTDSCSVDHSGFGLRDESEYQTGKQALTETF